MAFEQLTCEANLLSGFAILGVGLVWRLFFSTGQSKPDPRMPDLPGPTGGDRSPHVLMVFGGFWIVVGVVRCLGIA